MTDLEALRRRAKEALQATVAAGPARAEYYWAEYERLTDEANDLRLAEWWAKTKAELLAELGK